MLNQKRKRKKKYYQAGVTDLPVHLTETKIKTERGTERGTETKTERRRGIKTEIGTERRRERGTETETETEIGKEIKKGQEDVGVLLLLIEGLLSVCTVLALISRGCCKSSSQKI